MREGTDPKDVVVANSDSSIVRDPKPDSAISSESNLVAHRGTERSADQVSLRKILPASRFLTSDDLLFDSVAASPDEATEGQLVVYRIGAMCPSRVVAEALARGAGGILTEQVLPCPLPQCIVGDIEIALAKIAAHQHKHPDRELLNVAVVGSAGKTSTTLLIASLLRRCGIRTAYLSDLGESDGVVQTTSSRPMPIGQDLVEWLSDAVDSQCRASIVEISEEQARHGHYDAIEFDMVVVTGSSTCQGDFGPSGLQCTLDRLTRDGVVIAPADDKRVMQVIRESGVQVVTYGIRKAADLDAKIIDQCGGITTLLVTHRDTTAAMETSLCGPGMAANHAAATLMGLLLAKPLHEVVEKLGQLRSIPGRGQRLEALGHANVVLESGGSTDRIATALRTHRSMKSGGKLWCVTAIDQTMSPTELSDVGSIMERFADTAIVTSTRDGKPRFLSVAHQVLDGVQHCASFRLVADRQRALEWVIAEAKPQDTIVLFTNEVNQTAQQQRSDLEAISKLVQTNREQQVDAEPSESPKLSIFG